jgi:hypothetical protein
MLDRGDTALGDAHTRGHLRLNDPDPVVANSLERDPACQPFGLLCFAGRPAAVEQLKYHTGRIAIWRLQCFRTNVWDQPRQPASASQER